MNREDGIKQIEEAQWERDDYGTLHLYITHPSGRPVDAWLSMRPVYCDRGHIQLNIDGPLNLDRHDNFPRFFFSLVEADAHTRTFLKWRLWQERMTADAEMRDVFETPELQARIKAIWDAVGRNGPPEFKI
jgi:hypothetical protein